MSIEKSLKHVAVIAQNGLVAHESAARSLGAVARTIDDGSAIRRMIESMERDRLSMQAVAKSLEHLRRPVVFDMDPGWIREIERAAERGRLWFEQIEREAERTRKLMADFDARFCLPEISEAARLIAELQTSPLSEVFARYAAQASTIQKAMERMTTPWLDTREHLRSIASFVELQGIGHVLRTAFTFDDHLAAVLRGNLGDWRDTITWRPEVLADPSARSELYADFGFNRALTDFPPSAFRESLDISGLRREPPNLVELYGEVIPVSDDEDKERSIARTNTAHHWLLRLESQLRAFIDVEMTRAFGPDWPKHRLPNGLYEAWRDKKAAATRAGAEDRALIAYADFTDYEALICRRDNWRDVFAPFFVRPESIRETLQRLYPIRLDTMHARLITQDDELLLYVETRRLMRVIAAKN